MAIKTGQQISESVQQSTNSTVVNGRVYNKYTDENGEYVVFGGTKKVYLAEIRDQEKKAKLQSDIINFYKNQEESYDARNAEYNNLASIWMKKLSANNAIYNASRETVELKDNQLYELYRRNNTFNIDDFWNMKDKKLGQTLWGERKCAKSEGNIAFSLAQFERGVIADYMKLASQSELFKNIIESLKFNCLKQSC